MIKVPMNIPNILTLFRIVLIPVFAWYAMKDQYLWAVVIFLIAQGTDVLDGYIARKTGQITDFGKLFDPVADKLLQITAVFILAFKGGIPWIIPVILILKEAGMVFGGILFFKKKIVVSAKWYGKVASFLFFLAIVINLLDFPGKLPVIWIALAFTLFAMVMYIIYFVNLFNKQGKTK